MEVSSVPDSDHPWAVYVGLLLELCHEDEQHLVEDPLASWQSSGPLFGPQ